MTPSDTPDTPPANLSQLREMLEDMPEMIPRMLATFVRETALRLTLLKDAVAAADFSAIRLQAHTIRGSALNLDAKRVVELSGFIEKQSTVPSLDGVAEATANLEAEFERLKAFLAPHMGPGA